jgi:hypothetical protein
MLFVKLITNFNLSDYYLHPIVGATWNIKYIVRLWTGLNFNDVGGNFVVGIEAWFKERRGDFVPNVLDADKTCLNITPANSIGLSTESE